MEILRISILGDVCPTKDYRKFIDSGDLALWGGISEIFHASDLNVANFECPATNSVRSAKKCGPCQKAYPSDINWAKKMGFNILSLANNHIKDYGSEAVLETIALCKENNIEYVGAGKNADEARTGRIVEIKGRRIGIISFAEAEFNLASEVAPGASFFDSLESPEIISDMKQNCDYLIVLYHGGIEHYRYPSPLLQKKCRKMIRSGADFVLCQHSHCIGTYEKYQNGTILYGQGNGIFGYRKNNPAWNEGLLIQLVFSNTCEIQFTLLRATPDGIRIASVEETDHFLIQMEKESGKLADMEWLKCSWKHFCMKQADLDRPLFYAKNRLLIRTNRLTHNLLLRVLIGKNKEMITMNFLRCDALREAITTILEHDVYGN